MKFNKIMVDALYEIRNKQPIQLKSKLKLSAPNIGWVLTKIYDTTDDQQVRKMIIIFMREAGDSWLRQLLNTKTRQSLETGLIPDESMANVVFIDAAKHKLTYRTLRVS